MGYLLRLLWRLGRSGFWAGLGGLITILIVGGKTAWMMAPIIGLTLGLLAARDETRRSAGAGLRHGLLNGLVAGLMLLLGQLLRSFWIDDLTGERPLTLALGASQLDPLVSALLIGVVATLITSLLAGLLTASQRLQGHWRGLAVGALTAGFVLMLPLLDNALRLGWLGDIIPIIIFVLLALGLNIVVGYAGLLDLGYAAFFAIGAYTAGVLSSTHLSGQFPELAAEMGASFPLSFWLVIWIAAAVAAIFGIVLGAPTLPLRGDYLAIVTLGFGEIVPILFTNLDDFPLITNGFDEALNLTGGDRGISAIKAPALPIIERFDGSLTMIIMLVIFAIFFIGAILLARNILRDERAQGESSLITWVVTTLLLIFLLFAFFYGSYLPGEGEFRLMLPGIRPAGAFLPTDRLPWYYLIVAIFGFSIFFINRLRRSRLGRAWMAMREDELAAASMGIDLVKTKLMAFAMGATFSGFAGAFYGAYLGSITPSSFQFSESVLILCMVILGGLGNIPGVILGGLIIVSADRFFLNRLTDLIKKITANSESEFWSNFKASDYRLLLFGLVLVIMMLVRPEGLVPSARRKAELHAGDEPGGPGAAQENASLFDVRQQDAALGTE